MDPSSNLFVFTSCALLFLEGTPNFSAAFVLCPPVHVISGSAKNSTKRKYALMLQKSQLYVKKSNNCVLELRIFE